MGDGLRRAAAAAKRSRYENTPTPAISQRWADNDKRHPGREVVIIRFENRMKVVAAGARGCKTSDLAPYRAAICEVYRNGVKQPKQVVIDCDRFIPSSTGYKYVGEGAPTGATVADR